jgi:glycogen operon protein
VTDDSFLLLLNGGAAQVVFVLPDERWAPAYELELDTADDARGSAGFKAASTVDLEGRSVVLLRAAG